MTDQFSRTRLLFGDAGMEKLASSRVAVFGIGGVGGYVVEALARSGVGALDLIDNDKVSVSNINRQIIATFKTVGMDKVDAAEERIREINPDCRVTKHKTFFLPETKDLFRFTDYDYAVDAIDTVSGKIQIVLSCRDAGIPVISSMGAGNKMDPSKFQVTDIFKTSVDPLARVMRELCRKNGIDRLKVVYSTEEPLKISGNSEISGETAQNLKKRIPGSNAFVPSVAGLLLAGEVVRDLIGYRTDGNKR